MLNITVSKKLMYCRQARGTYYRKQADFTLKTSKVFSSIMVLLQLNLLYSGALVLERERTQIVHTNIL